jgi:EmrB/QacA subfamily drug resistance transporter
MLHHISMRQKILVMIAVMSGLFLVALDQTIISTALGKIVEEFNSFNSLGFVVTAYLLTSTVTVPLAGKLSDMFGRRMVLLTGVIVFTLGSLMSGLSGSIEQLILFRAIQGIGGGIIMANAFTIIGDLFTPRERGKWQGLFGAVFGLASVVGPLLGGFLTDAHNILGLVTDWRWTFFINIPIGIFAGIVIARYCPSIKHDKKHYLDYAGAATLTLALSSVVLAVDNTELIFKGLIDNGMSLTFIKTILFSFSAIMAALFVFAERRARQPIIPLRFFKNRTFTSVMIAALLFGAAFLGAILYLTQFNQQVFGVNATDAGLMLLPFMGGMIAASMTIGQIVSRTGKYKNFILVGFTIATVGIFALSFLTPTSPYWHEAIIMVFIGMGMGTAMPIMNLAVQNEFEQHDLGAATSSSQLFRGLGSTIGTAVLSGILTVGVTAGIGDIKNDAYLQSLSQSPQASQMLSGKVDANTVLQINAQRETIAEQANKAIDAAPIPTQIKDTQKEQFTKNQTEFKDTVVNAFSDSLHEVFYVSAGLMVLALIAVSFVKERKLRDGKNDAPGVVE